MLLMLRLRLFIDRRVLKERLEISDQCARLTVLRALERLNNDTPMLLMLRLRLFMDARVLKERLEISDQCWRLTVLRASESEINETL